MIRPVLIQHRLNSAQALSSASPLAQGCEIDLRSDLGNPGSLHLSHDPWNRGEDFEDWLKVYVTKSLQGPLILNTKEDGLELRVLELLATHSITNYFFLDTTIPTLVKFGKSPHASKFAVRLSKFENLEFVRSFRGQAGWVWIDCFEGVPLSPAVISELKDFKTCLVSPELQGRGTSQIDEFVEQGSRCTAICTKVPEIWNAKLANLPR